MSIDSLNSAIFEQMLRDACGQLEARLRKGESLVTEKLLDDFPELAISADGTLELLYFEVMTREELGRRPDADELFGRFPQFRDRIQRLLEVHDAVAAEEQRALEGIAETSRLAGQTWNGSEPHTLPRSNLASYRRIGPYELLEELGRGGTGIVYRARQIGLDRMVALKVIPSDHAGRDHWRRLQTEAEAAARLQHPNIVQIHEVGEEDGISYISLELVDGGNLADRLAQAPMGGDGAARMMVTIARAIGYAHAKGVVHRDLKPANILITKSNEPKIADFGLAKRSWEHERLRTRSGAILGTPGYMAPEQAMGKNDSVGPLADVYALGAILYELLTGRPPFHAGNLLETLEQVRLLDPVAPRSIRPHLDRDLETICMKCLRKQPESRYASADELADDLERYLTREPIRARHVGWFERWSKWVERRPAIASLTVAIAAVALLGLAGVFWQWTRSEQRRMELESALVEIKAARATESAQRDRLSATLYLQRIAAAYGEWLANHPVRAEQFLEQCDTKEREWEWRYLERLMHADHRTMSGHTLPVSSLAFSPDGTRIASSSALWGYNTPGEIIIWDARAGSPRAILRGHDGPVTRVAFSPDGRELASAGGRWFGRHEAEVILWDVETGKRIRSVKCSSNILLDIAYSDDGQWLAASGVHGNVHLWKTGSSVEHRTIRAHTSDVFCLGFRPGSRMLATGSRDSTVRLWDVATGEAILSLEPGIDVRALAFNPDGSRLAASTWNGMVKVWEISRTSKDIAREIAHHQLRSDRVRALQFSPDGDMLAVVCSDGSLRLWHPITGAEVRRFRAHSGNAIHVAFHPEGHSVATAGGDQRVKLWYLAGSGEPRDMAPHSAQISAIAFSHDGTLLAAAGGENHVHIGYGRKSLNIWDFEKQAIVRQLDGHSGWLTSTAFSPDGTTVASGGDDHLAIVWNARTGERLKTLEGHQAPVTGVSFHPSGKHLATCSSDKSIRLWNVETGHEVASLADETAEFSAIRFSSQGLLASASTDSIVRIWDVEQRQVIARLAGHSAAVSDVEFSPDGSVLASCGMDARLLVWERNKEQPASNTWTTRYQIQSGDRRNTIRIAFHPNGKRLVGVKEDSSVILWDMITGQEAFAQRTGPEAMMVGDVAFAPDGNRLAAAYANRMIIRDASQSASPLPSPEVAVDWHLRSASTCESDRNWNGARFHYDRLVAAKPENWMFHFRRGDTFAWQRQWSEAEEAYARGTALVQVENDRSARQAIELSRQYRRCAQIQAYSGRVAEAQRFLGRALEVVLAANDDATLREQAEITLQRGRMYHRYDSVEAKRAYAEAVELWNRVVDLENPTLDDRLNCANAMLNFAVYQPDEELYQRTRKVLEPLEKSNLGNRRVRSELALCLDDYGAWLVNRDRVDEAASLLKQALDLRIELVRESPNDLNALRLLARSYDRVSPPVFDLVPVEQSKAFWRMYVTTMEMFLKSRPSGSISADDANMCAWNLIICPFAELQNSDQAVEWGQIAVKQRPGDGGMINTLAAAYYRNGQWNKAHELLLQAAEIRKGGDVYDWLFLAMTCSRLGQREAASDWLKKSSEFIAAKNPKSSQLLRLKAEAEQTIAAAEREFAATSD